MDDDLLVAMQGLASRTWTRETRHHPGQLAWSARYAEQTSEVARVWEEEGAVVGWAWAEEPDHLELCLDPAYAHATDVAREMVDWFVAGAPAGATTTMVLAPEEPVLRVLVEAGFDPDPKAPWFTHHHLDLRDPAALRPVPDVPGYRVRAVEPGEAAQRAACHRLSWGSTRVTTAAYDALMATPPYRPGLDLVAVAPDGTWVASCLVWLDDVTGVALVEPVGCAEEHRRRGLASAVSLAALHAARAAGASEALVCPRGDDGYPVPRALYQGLGFAPGARTVTLVRDP